jgi:hypothetical protein
VTRVWGTTAERTRALVAIFDEVRDLPYAIDAAHDASTLERAGAGDCLSKSALLATRLADVGVRTRLVRWRYLLPAVVPEALALPSRLDVHRAVQVHLDGRWLLVDATLDPALAAGGLVVSDWDGAGATRPGYPMRGPLLVEDDDRVAIEVAQADVRRWLRSCDPERLDAWRTAYISWLRACRLASTSHPALPE